MKASNMKSPRGTTTKRARERRMTAYHEAGHAVAARKLSIKIDSITMIANDDKLANVRTRGAAWKAKQANGDKAILVRALHADLVVDLAGPIAQMLAGYNDNAGGHGSDFVHAFTAALMQARIKAGLPPEPGPDERQEGNLGDLIDPVNPLFAAANTIVDRAWAETVAMLQDNWQAVVRVAGALRKCNQLTEAELDRVIARGQRPR